MRLHNLPAAPGTLTTERRHAAGEAHATVWTARVLRTGVLVAAGAILAGLILFFAGNDGPASVDAMLGRGASPPPVHPSTMLHGLAHGSATAFIQFGLLVLILTPTARVALSLGLFARQRDWLFAGLAALVLVILILGLLGITR